MALGLARVTGRWRTGPATGLAYAVAVGAVEDWNFIACGAQITLR